MKRDIVVTWPRTRSLATYLRALRTATERHEQINYRVARAPDPDFGAYCDRHGRVYRVHDGLVHGYTELLFITYREDGEVLDPYGGFWPAGTYLVCDPRWYPIDPIPMHGFRGWRWFNEDAARAAFELTVARA